MAVPKVFFIQGSYSLGSVIMKSYTADVSFAIPFSCSFRENGSLLCLAVSCPVVLVIPSLCSGLSYALWSW